MDAAEKRSKGRHAPRETSWRPFPLPGRIRGASDRPARIAGQRAAGIALLAMFPTAVAASWLPVTVKLLNASAPVRGPEFEPITDAVTGALLDWMLTSIAAGAARGPPIATLFVATLP